MVKNYILTCFCVFLFLLLGIGCDWGKNRIALSQVLLSMPSITSGDATNKEKTRLYELIETQILASRLYNLKPKLKSAEILSLTLAASINKEGKETILLAGELSRKGHDTQPVRMFANLFMREQGLVIEDIISAIDIVLTGLYQQYYHAGKSNEAALEVVRKALKNEDGDIDELVLAILLLGELKDERAEPLLLKLLPKIKNVSVGNACVLSLGELKSQESMPLIIKFVERKPSIFRRQAIIAARKIGSRLAVGWLLVMAYGHDDPLVRKEAKDALRVVEKGL